MTNEKYVSTKILDRFREYGLSDNLVSKTIHDVCKKYHVNEVNNAINIEDFLSLWEEGGDLLGDYYVYLINNPEKVDSISKMVDNDLQLIIIFEKSLDQMVVEKFRKKLIGSKRKNRIDRNTIDVLEKYKQDFKYFKERTEQYYDKKKEPPKKDFIWGLLKWDNNKEILRFNEIEEYLYWIEDLYTDSYSGNDYSKKRDITIVSLESYKVYYKKVFPIIDKLASADNLAYIAKKKISSWIFPRTEELPTRKYIDPIDKSEIREISIESPDRISETLDCEIKQYAEKLHSECDDVDIDIIKNELIQKGSTSEDTRKQIIESIMSKHLIKSQQTIYTKIKNIQASLGLILKELDPTEEIGHKILSTVIDIHNETS